MSDRSRNIKVTKQPANAPSKLIVNTVEIRPIERTKQSVPNWRTAMEIAESHVPRRQLLFSMYHDTALDDQVVADWSKRVDAVTQANWQFVDKDGETIEDIKEIIDSIGFDELLSEIINTKGWGYTMLEPKFYKNISERWEMTPNLVPRRQMFPEKGIISYDGISDEGINIRTGIYSKTIMEVGNTKDLGLFLPASLPVILKRGGVGDFAHFVQVFGSPIFDAMWDGFDEKQKAQLNQSIKDIGNGGAVVRPKGTELTIIENKTAGNHPHSGLLAFLNECISKCLLGTTETSGSSQSSGYAQSKTHQEENNNKFKSDIAYVRKTLNSRFIKILATHGFDTKGGRFIVQDELKLSTKEHFEIVKGVKQDFDLPMDDQWLYETFNIKKPDDYEAQKSALKEAKTETQNNIPNKAKPTPTNPNPSTKKTKETKVNSKTKETEEKEVKLVDTLYKKLKTLFQKAPTLEVGANIAECCGSHHTIKLSFNDTVDQDVLTQEVWNAKGALTFSASLFKSTSQTLLKGFKKGWNEDFIKLEHNPSFTYGEDDPALLTAFEQNLFRFSGTKTLAQVQVLNQLFRESTSFADFEQKAKAQITVFNNQWLETEYNTAVLTGQASATYHRLIKQAHIFPYWKYVTVGDKDVRPEHALLDGLTLPANDPRWLKIFPPNGWNCRCRIVPIMAHEFDKNELTVMRKRADKYIGGTQFSKEKAQGFGVNRALLKQVFTANQQYVRKFPGKASRLINNLKHSDYELSSFSQAKKVADSNYNPYTDSAEEFYKTLEDLNQEKILRDYNNRPLLLEAKNFTRHINKKDNRVVLLNALKEVLKSPDESWLRGKELGELVHIKYYTNETIVVVSHIVNGSLELKTWFPLREKKQTIDQWRKGLLVFNK